MGKIPAAILAFLSISLIFFQAPAPPKGPAPATPPATIAAAPAVTEPGKVVLTIGNEKITAAQYDDLVNSLPAQYQTYAKGPGKRAFAEQLAQVKVLSAEAEKR